MLDDPESRGGLHIFHCSDVCVWVLLVQNLLQSCSRGGGRRVEDMCYERRRAEACLDESAHHALGTREEPGTLRQGATVFPGSSRLGIEPKTPGWLVQDPTTRPIGDLIPTIGGSGAHPWQGWNIPAGTDFQKF